MTWHGVAAGTALGVRVVGDAPILVSVRTEVSPGPAELHIAEPHDMLAGIVDDEKVLV